MYIGELIEQTRLIKPGDHIVALYENQQDINNYITSYIHAALLRNARCIYITGDADSSVIMNNLEQLADKLQHPGDLIVVNRNEIYSKDGKFDPDGMIDFLKTLVEYSVADGYSGLAITGEISWVLDYENGKDLIIEYEWKLNHYIFNHYPVSALCRYNIRKYSYEMISSIIQLHPYIIWKNRLHENPLYIPVAGFKNNEVAKYQVETWLENIYNYTSNTSRFKTEIDKKEEELKALRAKMTEGTALAMQELLAIHDPYSTDHSNNVADMAKMLAESLNMSEEFVTKIYYASLMHDIGKTLIPSHILNKPARLNNDELTIIRKHPEYGADALARAENLNEIAEAVRAHHEWYDGTGYPDGLYGSKISLMSRIISICDSYEAMINDRPYRKALTKADAIKEIISCSGKQFDPDLVFRFVSLMNQE